MNDVDRVRKDDKLLPGKMPTTGLRQRESNGTLNDPDGRGAVGWHVTTSCPSTRERLEGEDESTCRGRHVRGQSIQYVRRLGTDSFLRELRQKLLRWRVRRPPGSGDVRGHPRLRFEARRHERKRGGPNRRASAPGAGVSASDGPARAKPEGPRRPGSVDRSHQGRAAR